jgi:hypothetical protein
MTLPFNILSSSLVIILPLDALQSEFLTGIQYIYHMHCVAVEHIFSHVRVIRLAVVCAIEGKMDGICTYFFNSFPHVYDYFPCSLWNGVIMFIINVLCAFAWTYMDLFIVLMSVALTDKFRQLNRFLQSVQEKVSLF